jgi:membrane peptidoglycan carboxypeptidase
MNQSVNSVFAQMGVDVGMPKVMEVAGKLGMDTKDLPAVPAQTLGSMGASPLQMAGVYATLDNHGKKVTPTLLKKVESSSVPVNLPDPVGDQVISRNAADSVTSVLTGVIDDGTAKTSVRDNPLRNGQKVAGKTGTSDDNKSAWFTGYTPDLVTSVGLFGESVAENGKHVSMHGATGLKRINGGKYPAMIWADFTFGVQTKVSDFDLETDQGAAVEPSVTATPSQSPTSEAPSQTPTTEPPSQTPTTQPPSKTPTTQPPSQTPTSEPPTESPSGSPSGRPENPIFGGTGNGTGNSAQ